MISRDISYRNWKLSKTMENKAKFKRLRNKVNCLISHAKQDDDRRRFNINLPTKQLWKNIKKLGISKSNTSLTTEHSVNEINNYFSSNYTTDAYPIIHVIANPNGFVFKPINDYEIINAVHSIKSNAVGLDGLPINFIKIILPLVLPMLVHLFNAIILTSKFPKAWKKVKVIPIPKKPRARGITNLRPISLLSAISKVYEKIIKAQISEYINDMKYLNDLQSGFRQSHSTETALMKVHDDIALSIDKKGIAILLLIDFAKAFDRVSHCKLINKLALQFNFSSSASKLMLSYLVGRSQAVYRDGLLSDFHDIESGVPQGSVLGPLLFSLFINDLPTVLDHCSVHLFADDVQIYFCTNGNVNMIEIARKINHDLQKIHQWSQLNLLPINPSKTKALLISKLKVTPQTPELFMNGALLQFVEQANNLGIIFTNNLEWDQQISSQCGKIYGSLKKLNLTTKHFDVATKIQLFKTLILPHLIYGDFIYTNASSASLSKIRVALNACIRYVYNLTRYSRVSHLQKSLIGCPFSQFYKYRSCSTLFRIITTRKPEYLSCKLHPFSNTRTRNYLIPRHSSSYYSQSFFARGIVNWNSLPTSLKSNVSKIRFKRDLRTELSNINV